MAKPCVGIIQFNTMKKLFLLMLVCVCSVAAFNQPYKNGIYKFKFFDSEYNKVCGICKAIISGNSISIYAEEDCHRKKGELIEKGIIMKHKTGQ